MSAHAKAEKSDTDVDVVRVSDRNPKVRTIRVGRPTPQAAYIIPTLKGLRVTVKHFFRNVITKSDVMTVQYPEEKEPYPKRHRGLHRLMKREDGSERCVACMMCPTVCPANCITIVPAESTDKRIEKRPAIFEIDELRCVVCGLCVEACPCDAIRMDTLVHAPPVEQRFQAVQSKEELLSRGEKSTAVQGGAGPDWRDEEE